MTKNTPINPRLIYTLRHAVVPLHETALSCLYSDPAGLEQDVHLLRRHQMVRQSGAGLVWAGS